MVMMYETLFLAFVALVAPLFGKLAGYELHRKPFEFVACSGLFFLLINIKLNLLSMTDCL